jgi:Fur family ferric uptake transcriptional regulator
MKTIGKSGVGVVIAMSRHADDGPPVGTGPDWPYEPVLRAWAAELLGGVGLGATRSRVLVLSLLRDRARPVTAQELRWELTQRLRARGPGGKAPGLTTIYRVLGILAQRGLVHSFHRDAVTTAYRLCDPTGRHIHLICRCCGRVQERPAGPVDEFFARPTTGEKFVVENYQAELIGLCAACRSAGDAPVAAGCPHGGG